MSLQTHDESTVLCDSTLLDNYCLPLDEDCTFVNDVPEDIVSVMPNFPTWGLITPPHSGSSSEDESICFSPPPADTDSAYVPGLLWDTADDTNLSSIWDTPPTSPPRSFGFDAGNFDFDTPLLMDDPIASTPPLSPKKNTKTTPVNNTASRKKSTENMKSTKRPAVSAAVATAAVSRFQGTSSVTTKAVNTRVKSPTSLPTSHSVTSNSVSTSGMENPENKRRIHNVLERKRRNDLKLSYQSLRCQLPSLADNERAPTGHILIQAVDYITDLKKEEALLAQKTAALREQIEMKRRHLTSTCIQSTNVLPQAISA